MFELMVTREDAPWVDFQTGKMQRAFNDYTLRKYQEASDCYNALSNDLYVLQCELNELQCRYFERINEANEATNERQYRQYSGNARRISSEAPALERSIINKEKELQKANEQVNIWNFLNTCGFKVALIDHESRKWKVRVS